MSVSTTVEPIRRSITVEVDPAKAFEVFTARIGDWWIPDFKIGAEPYRTCALEPREGGRWYEIGEQGGECDWGRVLTWDPPARVVLAWQIDARWQHDPQLHTEVEVRFVPDGEGRTRVELEHRGLEAYGDAAEEVVGMLGGGWAALLENMAGAAAGA